MRPVSNAVGPWVSPTPRTTRPTTPHLILIIYPYVHHHPWAVYILKINAKAVESSDFNSSHRLSHLVCHSLFFRTFGHPCRWSTPNQVESKFTAGNYYCRVHSGVNLCFFKAGMRGPCGRKTAVTWTTISADNVNQDWDVKATFEPPILVCFLSLSNVPMSLEVLSRH